MSDGAAGTGLDCISLKKNIIHLMKVRIVIMHITFLIYVVFAGVCNYILIFQIVL